MTRDPNWTTRQADEFLLEQWLKMDATQPLVISGPRGTGKNTLVNHVVDGRANVVRIDVHNMLEKKDEVMVRAHSAWCRAPTGRPPPPLVPAACLTCPFATDNPCASLLSH